MSGSLLPSCFQRDLTDGLQQQMFFWGQDVLRPTGNFFLQQGFEKSRSKGLKGTSCYRLEWQGGHIELYGACAGWYRAGDGFTFIRPRRRCYVWQSSRETPIPGAPQKEFLRAVQKDELYLASLPFIEWLIDYEEAVTGQFGSGYRQENYRHYRKVPKAKQWVEPQAALDWFRCVRDSPSRLQRPKHYSQKLDAQRN